MTTVRRFFVGMLLPFFSIACSKRQETPSVRTIPLTRTIRIPAQIMTSDTALAPWRLNAGLLTTTGGGEDELPQGPESFEVLPDGGFVIADPLQRRVVFYDSLGNYVTVWPIGLAVNSITLREGGEFAVRQANSGDYFFVDQRGQVLPQSAQPRRRGGNTAPAEARLLERNRGRIGEPRARGATGGGIEIAFDSDTTQMVSLQNLGTDAQGNVYAVLEITQGNSAAIDVRKIVRKYSAAGRLIAEILDLPLEAEIAPVDELRLRRGCVYQLVPARTEVRINVWDTN